MVYWDLLARKAQEAIAQVLVGFESAGELRGDRRHIFVVNAARCHALVFGINQNGHTSRLQGFCNAARILHHQFL